MKIAFIGQKGMPVVTGGIERYVEEISTRLKKQGHEVFVYVRNNYTTDKKLAKYKGVNLIHLPSVPTKNLDAISHTFLATLHALFQNYDIVHYQAIGPTSLSFILKWLKPKTKILSTFQCQDYYHQKWGFLARLYLRFGELITCKIPDNVIVVNKNLRQYVNKKYHRATALIPNGASVKKTNKKEALEIWGLKPKKYILSVGRLIRHKGVHLLIEAFLQLKKEGRVPDDLKLMIVGDGFFTDDYVSELKTMAKGNKDIIFAGQQSGETLRQLFSHAHIFVQPSFAEGLSMALLEAAAYGLAPIVSDIPENTEAISENKLTFKTGDLQDLKEKMSLALNNPSLARQMAQTAKQFVEERYNWELVTKKINRLYLKTIN